MSFISEGNPDGQPRLPAQRCARNCRPIQAGCLGYRLTEFKGIKRRVTDTGNYTELFFLDEVTALSAGHRPCATCRRERYDTFLSAWSKGNRNGAKVLAGEVDKQMKLDRSPSSRTVTASVHGLPDGVMVKDVATSAYFLVRGRRLYRWSFAYSTPSQPPIPTESLPVVPIESRPVIPIHQRHMKFAALQRSCASTPRICLWSG